MGTGENIIPPLINDQMRERLDAVMDNPEGYWKVLAVNYLQLLPTRLERIRLALTKADLEGSLDAVLSLKTSSQRIGADRLAALVTELEITIRSGIRESNPSALLPKLAAIRLRPIRDCAGQVGHWLGVLLEK